jgi:hypothetical protein
MKNNSVIPPVRHTYVSIRAHTWAYVSMLIAPGRDTSVCSWGVACAVVAHLHVLLQQSQGLPIQIEELYCQYACLCVQGWVGGWSAYAFTNEYICACKCNVYTGLRSLMAATRCPFMTAIHCMHVKKKERGKRVKCLCMCLCVMCVIALSSVCML